VVGGIGIGDVLQRRVVDAQRIGEDPSVRLVLLREERFTGVGEVARDIERVTLGESRLSVVGVVGGRALPHDRKALQCIVMVVDQRFQRLLAVGFIRRQQHAEHQHLAKALRGLLRRDGNLESHARVDRLFEIRGPGERRAEDQLAVLRFKGIVFLQRIGTDDQLIGNQLARFLFYDVLALIEEHDQTVRQHVGARRAAPR
jgi:hypothetical protein